MRNLDFKKTGLKELSNKEMSDLEGGALFRAKGVIGWLVGRNSWSDIEIDIIGLRIK